MGLRIRCGIKRMESAASGVTNPGQTTRAPSRYPQKPSQATSAGETGGVNAR